MKAPMITKPNRRKFLATSATMPFAGINLAHATNLKEEPVGFFLIGDTHFLADKENPTKLDLRSASNTSNIVATLNRLGGTAIPTEAGGGKVLSPKGLIHAGDVIDTGDKNGPLSEKMQVTEWNAFSETFGLTGKEGKLKMPVYEVHGNHDSPNGEGMAVKKIIDRNKSRAGVNNISPNGVHYSWDWEKVHFINLGIVVGQVATVARKRRYNPLGSLEFLANDLKEKVGDSGRPVVITHHVDMQRYSQPLPVEDKKAMSMEWDPEDVQGFYKAIEGYNIAAVLYGHTHARNVYRWDGTPKRSGKGVPVFNVDNGAHFASKEQAFFYFEVSSNQCLVREYFTKDGWESGAWTPQSWATNHTKAKTV